MRSLNLSKYILFFLYVLFINSTLSAQDNIKSVTVEKLGTLSTLISETEKWELTELKVSGWLNGDDIAFLREMAGSSINLEPTNGKLGMLDMSGVRIAGYVADDETKNKPYLINKDAGLIHLIAYDDYFTGYYFAKCTALTKLILPDKAIIESNYFTEIPNLKNIHVTANSENLSVKDNILFSKDGKDLFYCLKTNPDISDYTVPASVEKIHNAAFQENEYLRSIIISDQVKEIGEQAFFNASKLESVHIGSGLQSLLYPQNDGYGPFSWTKSLKYLTVSPVNPYFKSENNALYSKDGCKLYFIAANRTGDFSVPETVTTLFPATFSLSKISSITFPDDITSFPGYLVENCLSLEHLKIGAKLKNLATTSFYNCTKLTDIEIDEQNEHFKSTGVAIYAKDASSTLLFVSDALDTYSVEEGTKAIKSFSSLCRLRELTLPSTLESIEFSNPFLSLEKVYCKAKKVPVIPAYIPFYYTEKPPMLYVPTGKATLYKNNPVWSKLFPEILEKDYTGIDVVSAQTEIAIKHTAGGILINSYNGSVDIYSTNGIRTSTQQVNQETFIPLPKGIYILRTDKGAIKVSVSE